jgi:alkylhydroperoxidase family enzyme
MKPTQRPADGAIEHREAYILGGGPRLQPLELNELSPALLDILERFENVNRVLQSDAEGDRGGAGHGLNSLPEIVLTMLRHAPLFALHTEVGLQLLARGALAIRDREFAVLRIAWLCQAPYEWGEHVLVAKRFGLTPDDIARVIDGPDAKGLDEHESAILRAVGELHGDAMITDATWHTLAQRLDERQLIELPIVVGQYQTVAYYQNSLRLRLHQGNHGLKAR